MREYIDIINEAAEMGMAKQKLTTMVKERLATDLKTMKLEEIVKAIKVAFDRVKGMSEEEKQEILRKGGMGGGVAPAALNEQHLKEFLGWDDVIVAWSFLIIVAIVGKINPMAFIEIVVRAAVMLVSLPYIAVRKIFDRNFTVVGYIDDLMRPVVDKY